jgi:rhodanese-related sulfurtransferase
MIRYTCLMLIAISAWIGCGRSTAPQPAPESEELSAIELKQALESEKPPLLVDVRTPEEFAAGHIPGAVNIPVTEMEARANELPEDQRVVLY